jgi:hypothetical protein
MPVAGVEFANGSIVTGRWIYKNTGKLLRDRFAKSLWGGRRRICKRPKRLLGAAFAKWDVIFQASDLQSGGGAGAWG